VTSTKQPSKRSAGILLHPTSLPGPYGIGDLGTPAYVWVDALVRARQRWWQILPLGPTGYGDSPYQCFSAFAGNPYLISPDLLVEDGLVSAHDLEGVRFPAGHVPYGDVIPFKVWILGKAWASFRAGQAPALTAPFEAFEREQVGWLDDFALFMAVKDAQRGVSWLDWPAELRERQPAALEAARRELADRIGEHRFRQFLFFRQWRDVKAYAHRHGLRLIGDVPIFVSSDSADVWANPELFRLDEHRRPTVVAGVPPDYFNPEGGQLWGNPLYDWERLRQTGYAWWVARLRATLEQVDLIRLDHFRGFEAYWEIPAGATTAKVGHWVKGPGKDLIDKLRQGLGGLPLIAEDLGVITPEVEALRDEEGLPGMRILQFAFGGAVENRFLPHHYERNTVVYTGTHDNDTTRGWYDSCGEGERRLLARYLGHEVRDPAWDLLRLAWASVADYALAPFQDVLSLGTAARMNFPGRPAGNWGWRFTADQLNNQVLDRLADLTELYSRWDPQAPSVG
jgi:4-alpha-glucanotransferase